MDKWIDFVIIALAAWRISSLLATEDGPFDVFGRLRQIAGVRTDEHGSVYGINVVSQAMICVWCNSVWVGIFLSVLYWLLGSLAVMLALPLAFSAVAIGIDHLLNKE